MVAGGVGELDTLFGLEVGSRSCLGHGFVSVWIVRIRFFNCNGIGWG